MLSTDRPAAMDGVFHTMVARVAWLAFGGALAGALIALASGGRSTELPKFFLMFQDAPVLLLVGLLSLAAVRMLNKKGPASPSFGWLEGTGPALILAAITTGAVYAGAYLVYRHYALSLDEFMAEFDARIFAGGHLLAPVAAEWRDYVPALQPIFRLEVPENAYWISSYLPVNAAFRAVFVLLGDPAFEGAVLAGIALLALYGVARRIWPERPDAAIVGTVLLACSSQFLITAMTPYAMTAHLALNLVWLWLFLRDTRWSHGLAAAIGFAACGLHQVVFHPLFVAPFLLSVLRARRWKLAAFYAVAYAAIGLFWILYWKFLLQGTGAAAAQTADFGIAYLFRRIVDMTQLNILTSIPLMGLNLFRFVAWQSPLTIPLALTAFIVLRRQNETVRDLGWGIFLTLAVVLILMPYQGHGWGYRYLHGLLGSLCLLAAQGWITLTGLQEGGGRKQITTLLAASAAVSLFVLLPWYAWQARSFVTPYAAAVAAIQNAKADVVIVDPSEIWFGVDLVRNDPYLRTSPKVMALYQLDEAGLRKLCGRYDVALFEGRDATQLGMTLAPMDATPATVQHTKDMRQVMALLNCGRAFDSRH